MSPLARLLAAVFGSFSYTPPPWLLGLAAAIRRIPPRVAGLSLLAVVVVGGGAAWILTRPPPPRPPDHTLLTAVVQTPPQPPARRSRSEPEELPSPLVLAFSDSAAPLDKVGQPVTAHVKLSPEQPGEWRWDNERLLVFRPASSWPIGQAFTVSIEPALVARPNLTLDTRRLSFSTEPFRAVLRGVEFYQDPADPQVKQVVATVAFNYPVDAAAVEAASSITSHPRSNTQLVTRHRLSVAFDDFRFTAFVRSESLPLPDEDFDGLFTLAAGVRTAQDARAVVTVPLTGAVTIPGRGSRFRVQSAQAVIVNDPAGDPRQAIVYTCTSDVDEQVLARKVRAWLLPRDLPSIQGRPAVKNMAWSADRVGKEVLALSTPLPLALIPGERELGSVHAFAVEAAPGAAVFLRVEAGVAAHGGYVLLKADERVLQLPQYPRELKLAHQGAILSVSGERKLTVTSRGIPGFKASLYRVLPRDLNHLLSQADGDLSALELNGRFNERDVSEVFTEVKRLEAQDLRRAQYASVDFGPYLDADGERRGLFIVKVQGWDPERNVPVDTSSPLPGAEPPPEEEPSSGLEAVDRQGMGGEGEEGSEGEGEEGYQDGSWGQLQDRRFVLLTDLGVIEKREATGHRWVYVLSFRSGQPVGGAQVEVLARNGAVLLRAPTDGQGAARLPPLESYAEEKEPVALVVRSGADVSFLPLRGWQRRLDTSRFDVGGVVTGGRSAALTAYAFSDRGLYRPGETVHLASLVRAVDWSRSMAGVPLELQVTDPRGQVVERRRVKLDASGFVTLDFATSPGAPTGTYALRVAVAEEKRTGVTLGDTSFRVEEFLPDTMRLSARFVEKPRGWVQATQVTAEASLKNLFGTSAAGHTVNARVVLSAASPGFAEYPGFDFVDPAQARRAESFTLDDVTTDAEGLARFTVDVSAYAPASYLVQLSAEGFELGGGRSVTAAASVVVSPRPYLVGFKADGDLSFIKRGGAREVEVVAVGPDLARRAVEGLTLTLVEQRYVSVLTRAPSGNYQYQSVLKDVVKGSEPFALGAKGSRLQVPSQQVGTFVYRLQDAAGVEVLRFGFTVAGEANVAQELEKNAELKLSLDRAEYQPGDPVTLQITAPYAGAGVITVERDRVYVSKSFSTDTTTTVQTIQVPADLEANGYVSVAFVRALDSPELYVSPLSHAVVPFAVRRPGQKLTVTVGAPALTRPGQKLDLTYSTERPARLVLFAVDEGILQVARHERPDPLGFFLARRALEVSTRQIVDQLLPEYRLARRGKEGGDGDAEEALARNLNPFKRKADAPAVFWSGLVEAGPQVRTASFEVPETFSGTLRVVAVAAAPDAMGVGHTRALVRGPFVISPSVPTFISPGDSLVVNAAVANNVEGSGEKAQVKVTLKPDAALALEGPGEVTLTIPEVREGLASFRVKANARLGDGALRFEASGAGQEQARTAHLSVRPASPYFVTTQAGVLRGGQVDVTLKRTMYDELARREVSLSLLPLGLARGVVDYLGSYPHLCSEQLASRAVPALVFLGRPEFGLEAPALQTAVASALGVLRARQNDEGGFGYWVANGFTVPALDVYLTLFLTEAKERRTADVQDVLNRALAGLEALVRTPPPDLPTARLHAQALYVLARNARLLPAQTAALLGQLERLKAESDVAWLYLAATVRLAQDEAKARGLARRFTRATTLTAEPEAYHALDVYTAQTLYLTSLHFPDTAASLGAGLLEGVAADVTRGLHSLHAGWSLLALDAYGRVAQAKPSPGAVTLSVQEAEKGPFQPLALPGVQAGELAVSSTARFSGKARTLRLTSASPQPLFYSVLEGGYDVQTPGDALKQGLEVLRTLEDAQGRPAQGVALGDELTVVLKARALSNRSLAGLALVDVLPSGFEAVLTPGTQAQGLGRLSSAGSTFQPSEVDVREDRVVLYGRVTPQVVEARYRIKAVAKGRFAVPPAYGGDMYDAQVQARSTASTVVVE